MKKKSKQTKKSRKRKAKIEISAGGVVFKNDRDGYKILLIKDQYNRWALPKGHLKKNENIFQAAIREISEETGLKKLFLIEKLIPSNYFFKQKGKLIFKIVYYFLFAATSREKIKINKKEVQQAHWFPLEIAPKKIAYKNLKKIIEMAIAILKKNRRRKWKQPID